MRGDSGKGAGGKTVAAGGVNAGDPQWREQMLPLQVGNDAGDGFEAQVGDVGDVLPGGQDDLSAAVSQEADKSKDAGAGLSAAQGEEVGSACFCACASDSSSPVPLVAVSPSGQGWSRQGVSAVALKV